MGALCRKTIYVLVVLISLMVGPLGALAQTDEDPALLKLRSLKQEQSEKGNTVSEALDNWQGDYESGLKSSGSSILRGLGLCVGILLIGTAVMRRFGKRPTSGARNMRVVERIALTSKTFLVLAEVNGQELLITVGPEQSTMLPANSLRNVITLGQKISSRVVCDEALKQSA